MELTRRQAALILAISYGLFFAPALLNVTGVPCTREQQISRRASILSDWAFGFGGDVTASVFLAGDSLGFALCWLLCGCVMTLTLPKWRQHRCHQALRSADQLPANQAAQV